MECRETHLMGLKKSGNHDCEGWTASPVVIYWSISIPISDPLFTENNIRGRDLCTVWPWSVIKKTLQEMKTWATILTFVIIQMLIWLFLFQDNKNMFCTVQKIFYHHGVLRQTSTVSRLQTWYWSILQIFVSISVNLLVNVQRFQVCKDAVESTKWNFKSTPWSILP